MFVCVNTPICDPVWKYEFSLFVLYFLFMCLLTLKTMSHTNTSNSNPIFYLTHVFRYVDPSIEDILMAHALWPNREGCTHKHCLHKVLLTLLSVSYGAGSLSGAPQLLWHQHCSAFNLHDSFCCHGHQLYLTLLRFYLCVYFALFGSELLTMTTLSQFIHAPCIQYLSSKQNG